MSVQHPEGAPAREGTDLLIAAGRMPNTDGIGLDLAGIELDTRGYVVVNERLETTAPEMMAVVQTAMLGHLPFTALRDALFTHPTAADGLTLLLAEVASHEQDRAPRLTESQ